MKYRFLVGLTVGAFAPLFGKSPTADTRNVLREWVQTEQIIASVESDWKLEKAMLRDSEGLLQSELERLDAAIAELGATASQADEERSELTQKRDDLGEAAGVVAAQIGELEKEIGSILKLYPDPLVERIKPLIRRIPENAGETNLTLGERVQNIVGILSQADKFNRTITQTSESRELDDGRRIEVRTIYWGLGGAFYVDAAGEYAGIGYPGEDGWVWPEVAGAGPAIKRLVGVYEGTEDIQFVEVPVQIK